MSTECRTACVAAALAGIVVLGAVPAGAQHYNGPRTPDGQPDIQGVWTNFDPTPFEAPDEADIERLAPLAAWFPGSNQPPRPAMPASVEQRSAPPQGPWGDGPGDALRNPRRRSMIVDPPNGRLPVRDEAGPSATTT